MTDSNTNITAPRLHSNAASALSRIRSRLGSAAIARVDRIERIRSGYITGQQDQDLREAVDEMIEGQAAYANSGYAASGAHKQRALFVIGDSGSGKSTAIRRLFAKHSVFQPYDDEWGQIIHPAISFEAPKPLTMKLLARNGLHAVGYSIDRDRQENQMWDLFKDQLKEKSVLWLHIDEMQHAIRSNTNAGIQNTADVVKSLLQVPDWPLNAIFSGVPSLAAFLQHEDKQLQNRCKVIRFQPLEIGRNTDKVRKALSAVVVNHAEMEIGEHILEDHFINRLMHATGCAFGTAVQFVREVVFLALRAERNRIEAKDFVKAYERFSGCRPEDNIFTVTNWQLVMPSNALKDYILQAEQDSKRAGRTKKRVKK